MSVKRHSQRKTNLKDTYDRTLERSLTNVMFVADVSQTVAISRNIYEYIQVKSDSCVNCAAKDFIDVEILLFTDEFIRVRNLTSAISATKTFVGKVICLAIVALILERNLISASTAGNTSLVVDI